MIDTHCHLNFSKFKKNLQLIIDEAHDVGVTEIIVPGTDVKHSRKAIEIAKQHDHVYAAIGIHPHEVHSDELRTWNMEHVLAELDTMVKQPKVVAIGEVGMDYHSSNEHIITDDDKEAQKLLFAAQISLAVTHNKSLIIHNRESKHDLLPILHNKWCSGLEYRAVFHCCEPDMELLSFAKEHKMFIGFDGDITYYEEKRTFVKQVPLDMIVLETDAPFLLPEPFRSRKEYPNKPYHIPFIAQQIADLLEISVEKIDEITTQNAKKLFTLPEK